MITLIYGHKKSKMHQYFCFTCKSTIQPLSKCLGKADKNLKNFSWFLHYYGKISLTFLRLRVSRRQHSIVINGTYLKYKSLDLNI